MRAQIIAVAALFLGACAHPAPELQTIRDVEVGPINHPDDAEAICHDAASAHRSVWTGAWRVTQPDVMAVCTIANARLLPNGSLPRLRRETEITVPHIASFNENAFRTNEAREVCRAQANARHADWTGLWWTPVPRGDSVCLLAPRRGDTVVEATLLVSEGPIQHDSYGEEFPMQVSANISFDVHTLPRDSAPVIGRTAPNETITINERIELSAYSHRGVVRRGGGELAARQIVFFRASEEQEAPTTQGSVDVMFPDGRWVNVHLDTANAPGRILRSL
ncbi:MAG: hypothetical protein HY054_05235 [Proteobacteria bacterium]|nr:hypothetical protein [Pseudomonadota bacterium]